ncbi:hypothetical protein VTK73DRAFT_2796 [Phialemonium thermophilum]|uniref:Uncharacterized protein n=1 Tax=Phialemonium thermophilum TaxID=223376 RepID=A0ABR3VPP9_9PEZI
MLTMPSATESTMSRNHSTYMTERVSREICEKRLFFVFSSSSASLVDASAARVCCSSSSSSSSSSAAAAVPSCEFRKAVDSGRRLSDACATRCFSSHRAESSRLQSTLTAPMTTYSQKQRLDEAAGRLGAQRRAQGGGGHVPDVDVGAGLGSGQLGDDRLLDGAEGPEVAARGADHADHGGAQQDPVVLEDGEDGARDHHEQGAAEQDAAAAQVVGDEGQQQREGDVAQQGQGHEEADARVGDMQLVEEEGQHEGAGAVGEHAGAAGQDDEPGVGAGGVDGAQARFVPDIVEGGQAHGRAGKRREGKSERIKGIGGSRKSEGIEGSGKSERNRGDRGNRGVEGSRGRGVEGSRGSEGTREYYRVSERKKRGK